MAAGLVTENKMKPLRVGIDASALRDFRGGGINYYIFYLLDELVKLKSDCQFFFYVPKISGKVSHFARYPNVTFREVPFLSFKNILWRNSTLPFLLWKEKIDVFWITNFYLSFVIPKRVKRILTIYDFVSILFPQTVTFLHGIYHRSITRGNLKRADYRVVISEGTGKRLKELFGLDYDAVVYPPHKTGVVYKEKSVLDPFLAVQGLEYNNYLVSVSTWEPRKNFLLLTRIYCKAIETYGLEKVMPMVIVGGGGWRNRQMIKEFEAAREKYPTHFKIVGRVDDGELALYLSGARFYVALSVYEGYGMPIAEARRCRTPVICMDVPEMREAAENDAIFVTSETVEEALPKMMLKKEVSGLEKKPFKLTYPTNAESAAKLAAILSKIQEASV